MSNPLLITNEAILIPLTFLIVYYDVRYRRIPNAFVLGTLISGLSANTIYGGWAGLRNSIMGCLLAFGLMFAMRLLTGLGAGDVKLFGAVGAVIGVQQVLPAFLLAVLLGGILAVFAMLRAGAVHQAMFGVYQVFVGLLPGGKMPSRATLARSGVTVPYGIAITCGSVVSVLGTLARG
jgi:prepilin peptidase CpaA